MALLSPAGAGPSSAPRATPSAASRCGVRVVALGGGTGLPIVLRGLKSAIFPPGPVTPGARDQSRLTAIVTAADDGGSSGRLREAFRMQPPGDIRNCLLALADGDPTLSAIFGFRFDGGASRGVGGHSLGNLILAALNHLESDFLRALERATQLLAVRGRVLPATLDDVRLVAEFTDETRVEGESRIARERRPIRRVYLRPASARALPEARRAIAAADVILLGPGSLYTSVIPVLLVRGLADAIAAARGRVVLALNLMSEPGETDGYGAADFVGAIRRHAPQVAIDDVLMNVAPIPAARSSSYAAAEARPVRADRAGVAAHGCRIVERDLLGAGPLIRHAPDKLARAILEIAREVPAR